MKVILHLGAQRTATTTFQHYMRSHRKELAAHGIGFWGPRRTRKGGLFEGLYSRADRPVTANVIDHARRNVERALEQSLKLGVKTLVISDENMLGTSRHNLETGALYPEAWRRLGRFAEALEGSVDTVMLGMRSLEHYWPSTIAFAVKRGAMLPPQSKLDTIVETRRNWCDVTHDVADRFSRATVELHDFAAFANRPDLRLAHSLGKAKLTKRPADIILNEAPDLDELRAILKQRGAATNHLPTGSGRYQPFARAAQTELKEKFADDMFWARGGATGVAKFIDHRLPVEVGLSPPLALGRGHHYDQARGMDRAS